MDWCDFATRDDKGAQNAGAFVDGAPPRGVLHTTEGSSYAGARDAFLQNNSWPHFTITNESGTPRVYQHLPVNIAARSLEHRPGSVETNHQGTIQIEIVGFAKGAPSFSKTYLNGIAKLMRWIETNCGVRKTCGVTFVPPGQEQRLLDRVWLQYAGWCGHQHIPNNSHEDPGAIDIAYLLSASVAPRDASHQSATTAAFVDRALEERAVGSISKQVKAFLDMISVHEVGTAGPEGYRICFTGVVCVPTDFHDHPRIEHTANGITSDAAGRYQFLSRTWDSLANALHLGNFSPPNQDQGAVELIRRRGALQAVENGDVVLACRGTGDHSGVAYEWASLPPGRYGQPSIDFAEAQRVFQKYGGVLKQARARRADRQ
jgi:muramidase (phage lysozyme)